MGFRACDYHPDWKNIVRQIKDQAGHCCEFCGVPDGEVIVRDRNHPERWRVVDGMEIEVASLEGEWVTRIVLTTAHLCWKTCADKKCIDPTHLRSLCQRCHLNWDREHHLEVQRQNRIARKLAEPLPLFDGVQSVHAYCRSAVAQ